MTRCRQCSPVPEEVRRAAVLLEGRWTVSILWASAEGASRFNELKQAVGEIPPRTLAQRLVELEAAGLLERRVIDARPPRVEYRLTDDGDRLRAVLDALASLRGRRLNDGQIVLADDAQPVTGGYRPSDGRRETPRAERHRQRAAARP